MGTKTSSAAFVAWENTTAGLHLPGLWDRGRARGTALPLAAGLILPPGVKGAEGTLWEHLCTAFFLFGGGQAYAHTDLSVFSRLSGSRAPSARGSSACGQKNLLACVSVVPGTTPARSPSGEGFSLSFIRSDPRLIGGGHMVLGQQAGFRDLTNNPTPAGSRQQCKHAGGWWKPQGHSREMRRTQRILGCPENLGVSSSGCCQAPCHWRAIIFFLLLLYLHRRMSNTLGASYPLERVRTILGQWFRPCVTPNPLVSAFLRRTLSSSCKRMRSLAGRERWRNTCVCIGQLTGILKLAALASPAIEGISVR